MTCVTVHTLMDSYFCTNSGPAAVLYIPAKNNPAVRQGEGGYSAAAAAHGRCLCRDSTARLDPLIECACVGCMLHLAVDAAATHILNACGTVLSNSHPQRLRGGLSFGLIKPFPAAYWCPQATPARCAHENDDERQSPPTQENNAPAPDTPNLRLTAFGGRVEDARHGAESGALCPNVPQRRASRRRPHTRHLRPDRTRHRVPPHRAL